MMRQKSALLMRHTANSWYVPLHLHSRAKRSPQPRSHVMLPLDVTDRLDLCLAQSNGKHPSDKDLQRADGFGRIVLSGSEDGTCIEDVFERSPIRIMFPRTEHRRVEEAVIINTGGGVAGGGRLECFLGGPPRASIAVTSQAAEKVYRALHEPARVTTKLKTQMFATASRR